MDLTTRYLGFELPHPLICGASPLAFDLDSGRRLEDAGAAAIVLPSLFEEELGVTQGAESEAREALANLPEGQRLAHGPETYLERLRQIKQAVRVPVFASLNGSTLGGWLAAARLVEQAGADAIELDVYRVAADPELSARDLEAETIELVAAVADSVMIPIAVKLSPFYTALAHLAQRLVRAGAEGLVLFNRFYQADVDLERFELAPRLVLSNPSELLLRLRWLAILHGQVGASLAVTGGVHSVVEVVKAVACGADAVQMVSALLRHGPERLTELRRDLGLWLEAHGCDALSEIAGALSLADVADPAAFERSQYLRVLRSWRPPRHTAGETPES
jgi:dihydroorotate dehydrogenase (fumarate)